MAKKIKTNRNHIWVFVIIGVIAISLLLLTIKMYKGFRQPDLLSPNGISSQTSISATPDQMGLVPITPTIMPASRQGWNVFLYPDPSKRYSFEYPSSWTLDLQKPKNSASDDIYVGISYQVNGKVVMLSFSNGSGEYGNEPTTTETKEYGGRKFTVLTLYHYHDNLPYREWISPVTPNDHDSFVTILVDLPASQTTEYQQTVDQILSSLKFYY